MIAAATGTPVEERGGGTPVLLVHGLGQGIWAWRGQLELLGRRHRAIALDLPDAGTIDHFAGLAAGVLRKRDAVPAHVVGFSMGGYVTLRLALAEPELVRSLVLAGTGAGGPERVPRPADVVAAFAEARCLPPAEFGRATMPYAFAPGWAEANPGRFEEILAARLERPRTIEAIDAHVAACYRFYDEGTEVERIEVPALVLHGDRDRIVPVENGRALAARLPRGELVELAGLGHNLMLEEPATFATLVEAFLDRVEQRRG